MTSFIYIHTHTHIHIHTHTQSHVIINSEGCFCTKIIMSTLANYFKHKDYSPDPVFRDHPVLLYIVLLHIKIYFPLVHFVTQSLINSAKYLYYKK